MRAGFSPPWSQRTGIRWVDLQKADFFTLGVWACLSSLLHLGDPTSIWSTPRRQPFPPHRHPRIWPGPENLETLAGFNPSLHLQLGGSMN
ncbi:MAG: hypothetical protein CM15mP77_4370 [Synechococcus sp.]|nr:MAG: hypothetical protein CM15mP77_4370 [Synechococcus sp.]